MTHGCTDLTETLNTSSENMTTDSTKEKKQTQSDAEKLDDSLPIDKGWAWVILAASFFIAVINVGTEKAAGLFFVEFLKTFKGNVSNTALVSSMLDIVYACVSVLVLTVALKRFTVRSLVCTGLVLSAVGYGVSSFSQTLTALILIHSTVIGAGIAFYATPIFILIAEYFDKRKAIANAVFISGNSLGGLVMPPLYRYTLDTYGLRGALVMTSGIILNSVVCGALLRPMAFYTKKKSSAQITNNDSNVCIQQNVKETVADRKSVDKFSNCFKSNIGSFSVSEPLLLNSSIDRGPDTIRPRCSTVVKRQVSEDKRQASREETTPWPVKCLSQSDFRSTSLAELQSTNTHGNHEKSVSNDSGNKTPIKCFRNIFIKIKSWDYSLLKNGPFIMFMLTYSFGNLAVGSAHLYVPPFARDVGIDDQKIAILVSITSLTDFFGRLGSGYIVDKSWISPTLATLISQVIVAIALQFSTFCTGFWQFMVFVAVYGSSCGVIAALFPPMMLRAVGKEKYPLAIAIFVLENGICFGISLPLLGHLRDVTGTFHATYRYISCCSFVTVGLLTVQEILMKKTDYYKEGDKTDVEIAC